MERLGFIEYLADPDFWMCREIKTNSQDHYDHVLLCTDDDLVASCEAKHDSR